MIGTALLGHVICLLLNIKGVMLLFFSDRHNGIASVVFGSNKHVILGMREGVILDVALYASKYTHDETVKDYAEAGLKMIQKVTAA